MSKQYPITRGGSRTTILGRPTSGESEGHRITPQLKGGPLKCSKLCFYAILGLKIAFFYVNFPVIFNDFVK